jgi:predicted metalloprotease
MKIPPAVQMTAGGMLIFLVVSKKHRHVKRQTPDAVFLHHILKSGFGVVDRLLQGPFLCPAAENADVFLRFFTTGKTRTEAPFSVLNL